VSVWRFEAIGAPWEIETSAPLPTAARSAVEGVIAEFDAAWSRFRDDSPVAALARGAGSVPAPPDTGDLFATYSALSDATDGAVNPLVGASLESLGYDASYSFAASGPVSAPGDWRDRVRFDGGRLTLAEPALIDVGAIGKGRLVDLVAAIVAQHVRGDVIVDASGDLAVRGRSVRIGLEHPFDPNRAIGVWTVTDAALCASATNRRAWGDGLHHVLDARTGEPVRAVTATWAVAQTAMRADAIATALFFDGGARLAHEWGVQWVRMLTDGRVEWSPGCGAEVFRTTASVEP
jgi:thiamine biosynthesis lipoprotein